MHTITLGQYKNLGINKLPTISDRQIQMAANQTLSQMTTQWATVNSPIEIGDKATISLTATCQGLPAPELSTNSIEMVAGNPSNIPELEAIIGKKQGEIFTVEVKFDDLAPTPRYINKTILLEVEIKSVQHSKPTIPTDEIAKMINPNVENLADLKEKLQETIKEKALDEAEEINRKNVLDAILTNTKINIDEEIFKPELEKRVEDENLKLMMDFTKVANAGENSEAILAKAEKSLIDEIKEDLIISEIAKKENIEITQEDVEKNRKILLVNPEDYVYFDSLFPKAGDFEKYLLKEEVINKLMTWNLI